MTRQEILKIYKNAIKECFKYYDNKVDGARFITAPEFAKFQKISIQKANYILRVFEEKNKIYCYNYRTIWIKDGKPLRNVYYIKEYADSLMRSCRKSKTNEGWGDPAMYY